MSSTSTCPTSLAAFVQGKPSERYHFCVSGPLIEVVLLLSMPLDHQPVDKRWMVLVQMHVRVPVVASD